MYRDDRVLCGELEEDLRVMNRCFLKACRRRGLKVNADKSRVLELGGD